MTGDEDYEELLRHVLALPAKTSEESQRWLQELRERAVHPQPLPASGQGDEPDQMSLTKQRRSLPPGR